MRKWIAGTLLCVLALSVFAGIPANLRITAVLTPGGTITTKFRDGNDGSAAVPLTWATISTIVGVQGTPQTINLRSLYLTEPGSPNATLTFSAGCTGGGWTTTADGLSYTYSSVTSATCQVTATRSGFSVLSGAFALSSTASAGADTTAPSQVLGAAAVQTATGIRITAYPSSDPKVNSQTWSGLADYKIYRDGSGTALATLTAPSTGLQVQLLGSELGGSTGGSATQTGNAYSIVSAGDGIGGTTDVGYFAHQTVSGDFRLCADLHGISGGDASNAHITLMARASLTATDPASFFRKNYVNFRVRGRGTASASAQQYGSTITISGAQFACFVRTGSAWSSTYSTLGATFSTVDTSMPTSLPSQIEVGGFVGTGGGSTTTGDFREVTLSQHPTLTYDDPITDGASHSYTIKARDVAGNLSTASVSVSATAPATSDVTAPSAPTGLTGGTSAIQTTVSWTWNACTDTSGIRGYVPTIATTSGGTYTDQAEQVGTSFDYTTGITASTTRWAKIKCIDNAGNASAFTSAVSATSAAAPPADSTPPTVPSGSCTFNSLAGPCATGLNTTTIRVVTTGSTDAGAGVADYRLYQSTAQGGPFALVATFTGLTYDYAVGGAAGTTYFFKLTARDAASPQNESAQSETFTGATTAATGGTLDLLENFTTTTLDAGKWHTSSDAGGTRVISAGTSPCTPAREGAYSIRQTSDGTQDTAFHEEIIPNVAAFTIGKTYWLGESICVGDPNISTSPSNTTGWYFPTQIHSANGVANPQMSLKIQLTSSKWAVQILADNGTTFATPYDRNVTYQCTVPVTLGVWTDVVMNFRFGGGTVNGTYMGNATPGFWKIWIKDTTGAYVQCIDDVGFNYIREDEVQGGHPYVKIGQYRGYDLTHEPTITTRSVSHDAIRIGREEAGIGFNDVAPQ